MGRKQRNATSSSRGRRGNEVYRVREHLTEAEIEKLLAALKRNRYGHRDSLIGLLIYRHGLRVSEAIGMRRNQVRLLASAAIGHPKREVSAAQEAQVPASSVRLQAP